MGGLLHDFHLVNREEVDYWNSSHFHNHPQAVLIHDDVIRFMSDSWKWIDCHVPMTPPHLKEVKGLHFYGPTIISQRARIKRLRFSRFGRNCFRKDLRRWN